MISARIESVLLLKPYWGQYLFYEPQEIVFTQQTIEELKKIDLRPVSVGYRD